MQKFARHVGEEGADPLGRVMDDRVDGGGVAQEAEHPVLDPERRPGRYQQLGVLCRVQLESLDEEVDVPHNADELAAQRGEDDRERQQEEQPQQQQREGRGEAGKFIPENG